MIYIVCGLIIAIIYCGDMWVKNRVEQQMGEEDNNSPKECAGACSLLGGRILIRKYHNKGAILNWGHKRRRMVAVVSVVLCVMMWGVFMLSFGHRGNHLLRIGLAFLLGGAFSNTYDRLKRKHVVDYFSFGVKWKWLSRIIFNISDFGIIIGALIAALSVNGSK